MYSVLLQFIGSIVNIYVAHFVLNWATLPNNMRNARRLYLIHGFTGSISQ